MAIYTQRVNTDGRHPSGAVGRVRIFVSYSHEQCDWVRNDLCAVLKAAGVEVLVDYERFEAGLTLLGQMDGLQDQADACVLVLSRAYLASAPCMHEFRRALALDPDFTRGVIVPVVREECDLPTELRAHEPIWVDLRRGQHAGWDMLIRACRANLGCAAAAWLAARAELVERLARGESANLVVRGRAPWRPLIAEVSRVLHDEMSGVQLGIVELQSGAAASRRGLLEEMLRACGSGRGLPSSSQNEDLVAFTRALRQRERPAVLALQHFDYALQPGRSSDANLFAALRDLVSVDRKLCLLIHSKRPFLELLPADHPLSSLTQLRLVELVGT